MTDDISSFVGVARIDACSEDDINGGDRVSFGGNEATVFTVVVDDLLIPKRKISNENIVSFIFSFTNWILNGIIDYRR